MVAILAPKLGRFYLKFLSYYRAPVGALVLHSLVLYSDNAPFLTLFLPIGPDFV